jgi:threonine dehydratase
MTVLVAYDGSDPAQAAVEYAIEEHADKDIVLLRVVEVASGMTDAAVIGAQSEAAPAMYRAWANDHLEPHDRMETFAEGIATRVPFALTTRLLRDRLDNFQLVSEDAIRQGVGDLYRVERIPMEGACAASLAAMRQRADELSGATVVFPVSGRNIELEKLETVVAETV